MHEETELFPEIISLIRAVIWPVTLVALMLIFRKQVARILAELPLLLRRLVSGKALGIEVHLREIESTLPTAEREAGALELMVQTESPLRIKDRSK